MKYMNRIVCRFALITAMFAAQPFIRGAIADDAPASVENAAEEKLEVISPEAASADVGKKVIVQMKVKAAKFLLSKEMCFLNSEANHRSEKNFTVVIFREGVNDFRDNGIRFPDDHFRDKTIQVTGKVTLYSDKPQIEVHKASQIRLVEDE